MFFITVVSSAFLVFFVIFGILITDKIIFLLIFILVYLLYALSFGLSLNGYIDCHRKLLCMMTRVDKDVLFNVCA